MEPPRAPQIFQRLQSPQTPQTQQNLNSTNTSQLKKNESNSSNSRKTQSSHNPKHLKIIKRLKEIQTSTNKSPTTQTHQTFQNLNNSRAKPKSKHHTELQLLMIYCEFLIVCYLRLLISDEGVVNIMSKTPIGVIARRSTPESKIQPNNRIENDAAWRSARSWLQ